MFKKRTLQVQVVKTPKQETPANTTEKSNHLSEREVQLVKDVAVLVGQYYLAKVAIDTALKLYTRKM